jgi:hypothetical protein
VFSRFGGGGNEFLKTAAEVITAPQLPVVCKNREDEGSCLRGLAEEETSFLKRQPKSSQHCGCRLFVKNREDEGSCPRGLAEEETSLGTRWRFPRTTPSRF